MANLCFSAKNNIKCIPLKTKNLTKCAKCFVFNLFYGFWVQYFYYLFKI